MMGYKADILEGPDVLLFNMLQINPIHVSSLFTLRATSGDDNIDYHDD